MSSKLDVDALSHKENILGAARLASSNTLSETHLHKAIPSLDSKSKGKVRDVYEYGDYLVIVTTDRLSAFDRVLASIPFKGQVLNEISLWWFDQTRHITQNAIISQGLMTQDEFDEAHAKALALFEYGQLVALSNGLLLVDTKYEFGKGSDGSIVLIDEVHTPDSSRYWIAQSYPERLEKGLEPENVDKEFLRLWFKDHCNPYEDEILPNAPLDIVCELAWRYIFLYEKITNKKFELPKTDEPVHDSISRNVSEAILNLV